MEWNALRASRWVQLLGVDDEAPRTLRPLPRKNNGRWGIFKLGALPVAVVPKKCYWHKWTQNLEQLSTEAVERTSGIHHPVGE